MSSNGSAESPGEKGKLGSRSVDCDQTIATDGNSADSKSGWIPVLGKGIVNAYTRAANVMPRFPVSPPATRPRRRSPHSDYITRGPRSRTPGATGLLDADRMSSETSGPPSPLPTSGCIAGGTLSDEEAVQRVATEIAKQTKQTMEHVLYVRQQRTLKEEQARAAAAREKTEFEEASTTAAGAPSGGPGTPEKVANDVAKFSMGPLDAAGVPVVSRISGDLSEEILPTVGRETIGASPAAAAEIRSHNDGALSSAAESAGGLPLSYIDRVIPSLRDISVPSGIPNMEPGRIYRGARPFSTRLNELYDVYVSTLRIATVIDLRDDDLSTIPSEADARLALGQFYHAYGVTAARPKQPIPIMIGGSVRTASRSLSRGPPETRATPSVPGNTVSGGGFSGKDQEMARLASMYPDWSREVINELVTASELTPLKKIFMFSSRSERRMFVINLFDCPAVKKRIIETATASPYLPVLLAAKAADKLAGTALAPYYFCKLIMSTQTLVDSYIEMLKNCGAEFAIALKSIALAPWPILFHCSLGKDRTGCLSMMLLHTLGAHPSGIIFDYSLTEMSSNQAYQDYIHKFTCTYYGLPKEFCRSPVETMGSLLDWLKQEYGGVDGYLDRIGFHEHWRCQLKRRYLVLMRK